MRCKWSKQLTTSTLVPHPAAVTSSSLPWRLLPPQTQSSGRWWPAPRGGPAYPAPQGSKEAPALRGLQGPRVSPPPPPFTGPRVRAATGWRTSRSTCRVSVEAGRSLEETSLVQDGNVQELQQKAPDARDPQLY